MFTGLVQSIGSVHRLAPQQLRVSWRPGAWPAAAGPLALGDSVAVDGVCLTVAQGLEHGFLADVSSETLARTTLGAKAKQGGAVNLEPALRLSDRLGGHLVSGHVDGLGRVEAITREGEAWRLELSWQESRFGRYICEKASVAVNGISLTVAGCAADGQHFWIAVIPHTWSGTTLQQLRTGDTVNLEADLLAKYAERLLHRPDVQDSAAAATSGHQLSDSWLQQHGWG